MNTLRLHAPERLDESTGRILLEELRREQVKKGQEVVLDLSGTKTMDSLGGAWILKAADHVRGCHGGFTWEGEAGEVALFMAMVEPGLRGETMAPERTPGFLEAFGGAALDCVAELRDLSRLCVEALYWTVVAHFDGAGFRWPLFVDELYEMGVRAVRIVCLMNFLLGLIMAMLFAQQAEMFGLAIYVADLIVMGFSRELAAIMTAVVVSARTGAAIAAELATMKVQEEIDALRGMGLNVTQFLVAPKMLALLIALPCLTALGLISGIAGGMLWGVLVLGFSPGVWWNETLLAANLGDITQGGVKTFVFAIGIVIIGCHNGLRVTGGSRGVGLMTTRAVVMDIFMLICVDIAFAALFYYSLV